MTSRDPMMTEPAIIKEQPVIIQQSAPEYAQSPQIIRADPTMVYSPPRSPIRVVGDGRVMNR